MGSLSAADLVFLFKVGWLVAFIFWWCLLEFFEEDEMENL